MTWDQWSDIEAAQLKADAEDAVRRQERTDGTQNAPDASLQPQEPTDTTHIDPEAVAAIAEAQRLFWPHPIAPTTPWGARPTNADGSRRDGSWHGGEWHDRVVPPHDRISGLRAHLRRLRDAMEPDTSEEPPWTK